MTVRGFAHLHTHSEYSLLDGCCRLANMVEAARDFGMPAVALTDHGVLYGLVEFTKLAKKAGVKPIIGCEVYVAPRTRFDRVPRVDESPYHLVLLVKDEAGYKNLLRLVSLASIEGFYYKPRVDKELLRECHEGLIALSACLAGEVASLCRAGRLEEAERTACEYRDIFGQEDFYLELQDNGVDGQLPVNATLIDIARRTGIGLVATNDVHYLKRDDATLQDVMLCIQTARTVDDPDRLRFETDQFYFRSPDEMWEIFKAVPEALENTVKIAERCNFTLPLGGAFLPEFQVPQGLTAETYLTELCREALPRRYGEPTPEVRARLDHELATIAKMGYAGYFLIVWDFVRFAKEQGIPVGPGRGSAAGSMVAYLLGITDIDPLKYGLIFERFLNPERVTMPDIDIDFCFERRGEVIEYVQKAYGADRVAQIVTFGTLAARAAIRDVGRALGFSVAEADRLAKLIPFELGITLDRALETVPELREAYRSDERARRLLNLAKEAEGLPRHASTHAAGVVISDLPLLARVPVQKTGDVLTTQFEMDALAEVGVLKMDFLGLRTLTVLDQACRWIERRRGRQINWDEVPLDDEPTFAMLQQSLTEGVFQMESRLYKGLLHDIRPACFEDLIAIMAIGRPGPMSLRGEFAQRKQGLVEVKYPHESLRPILAETYGIMIYQEQVMHIASRLAGFSMGEADLLRRAMSKKKASELLKLKERFVQGGESNGIAPEVAEEIFTLMEDFANYGFNKSHAAAYALVTYRTAYLKCHYPTEYMAALLASVSGDSDKVAEYINECGRLDIKVLPPDINESDVNFTVTDSGIRFGLASVKNVGFGVTETIIRSRRSDGPFKSPLDLCERVASRELTRKVIESFIKSGAFSSFGHKKSAMLLACDAWLEAGQKREKARNTGQTFLFDAGAGLDAAGDALGLADVPELPRREALAMEREVLGLYLSGHPAMGVAHLLGELTTTRISELGELRDQTEVVIGGLVAQCKSMLTKKQQRMLNLRLEDLSGGIDVVVFPRVLGECGEWLKEDSLVLIAGRLDVREDGTKLLANWAVPLSPETMLLELPPDPKVQSSVKAILAKHTGTVPVFLRVRAGSGANATLLASSRHWVTPSEGLREALAELVQGPLHRDSNSI